jgi:UDP-N-acetyl-D-glucosamine dehydrogenase
VPATSPEDFAAACRRRELVMGVVGLGGVGLPLAAAYVDAGFRVVGLDRDAQRVRELAAGRDVLRHQALAAGLLESGRFLATTDPERLSHCAAAFVCVPTPLAASGLLDEGPLSTAVAALAGVLPRGALVVIESTLPPGGTRTLVAGALAAQGRADLLVAHSPEREDPGAGRSLRAVPKLVAGRDERSLRAARSLHECVFDSVVPTESLEVAEAAKLYENAYRSVNIALANEFAAACAAMGLDARAVLDAAATKPFGFQRFDPGPGMGGHCIPKDARLLANAARAAGASPELLELAARIHERRPLLVIEECAAKLGRPLAGARVLLLGVAYKRDVDVTTHAPALVVARELARAGAEVGWHDPLLSADRVVADHAGRALPRFERLEAEALSRADLVVVLTDHRCIDWDLVRTSARAVLDTRGVLRQGG